MKVLLADECPATCAGLKEFLRHKGGVEIAGEAATARETLRMAARLRPDLVVLDPNFSAGAPRSLRRGETPGVDICRELKTFPEPPQVIIYTAHNSPVDVAAVTLAGADGYIHKSTPQEQLGAALKRALAGEPVQLFGLSPEGIKNRLLTALKVTRLSPREKIVFELMLKRRSIKEIAESLHIVPQTVKNHAGSILRKLGYKNRIGLYKDWGA